MNLSKQILEDVNKLHKNMSEEDKRILNKLLVNVSRFAADVSFEAYKNATIEAIEELKEEEKENKK